MAFVSRFLQIQYSISVFYHTETRNVQGDYESHPGINYISPRELTNHDTVSGDHRGIRATVGRLPLGTPGQHFPLQQQESLSRKPEYFLAYQLSDTGWFGNHG